MMLRGPFKKSLRATLLIAIGSSALVLSCDASLENVCFDGQPCTADNQTQATTTAQDDSDFPCDVFAVLEANCHSCHNANHDNGAPIDLLTCGRFTEADCGVGDPRHKIATNYVSSGFMPLGADLTADEQATLMTWLDDGAPCEPSGGGCTGTAGTKACYEE